MPRCTRRADPDAVISRRMARKVGLSVALLSAVMVIAGAMVFFSYLWVDDRQSRGPGGRDDRWGSDPREPGLIVRLDPEDVFEIVPLVGGSVILLAGLGAMLFARRAAKPLEESLRLQRNFVGDASHELRTPLAVLDARIQQAQLAAGSDEKMQQILGALRTDSQRMTQIVNDLLTDVSQDADAQKLTPVVAVVRDVAEEIALVAAKRQIAVRLNTQVSSAACVAVPHLMLRRSVTALTDNAVAHSPTGSAVQLDLSIEGRWVVLRVSDQGGGIIGIAPNRIFERFSRGAQATEKTEKLSDGAAKRSSHGIGLALVHDMAVGSGGSIRVERTGSDGTVMCLKLLLKKERSQ